jgi:hypothetical protein
VACFDCFAPGGKSPRYPLDRRLVVPQSRSGHCDEVIKLVSMSVFWAVTPCGSVPRKYCRPLPEIETIRLFETLVGISAYAQKARAANFTAVRTPKTSIIRTDSANFVNLAKYVPNVVVEWLTLLSLSSSKCYLRIQSVPQREHHTSPLQRSTG